MPAQRPRASFEPIPPDFNLDALVEKTPNFTYVDRISCDMIDQQGVERFDKLVILHVIIAGKPLVIDGYQSRLDPWTFSSKWLMDNHGDKVENARNLGSQTNMPLTVRHYLSNMSLLTEQYFEASKPQNYKDKNRQRMYLKDIDCPKVWQDKLKDHLPPNLFYLNEGSGEIGGPGAADEAIPGGGKRKGRGIAAAGDLMSSLPPEMRAENLMCYIGHEGTYTPAHKEMCGSLGHNIMVESSDVLGDTGKPERPGSSIWFMTETKDRHAVSEYWLSKLGHDIEVENHFAQIAAWKNAPFTTYVVEQRPGDFILIPPLAPHQVWNRGTRTMKVAWNRTTIETLELAMQEALPNAKMVCRDEQYKNKAIVYFTLQKYSNLLAKIRDLRKTAPNPQEALALRQGKKIKQLQKDFKRLFQLYKDILLSEMFDPSGPHERNVQFFPFDSNITCSYCRGNIFNKFLTCPNCAKSLDTEEPEPYDVCMECYAMGRSCRCISKLNWGEQFKWKELVQKYENWRNIYLEIDGGMKEGSPLPIQEERSKLGRKTLAQVCQEQLRKRPWIDIAKPDIPEESEEDVEIPMNEDGTVKAKGKKRRSETWLKNHRACHVCCHRHEKWKMAECKCGRWWCYGTLFRGHDLRPLEIMQDPNWECPHCKGVCSAGSCRKDPRQKPYEPTGTLLGHDTRKVADVRSVESLVDFGQSNLRYLKENADIPVDNARLDRFQEDAERAKQHDPTLDERYVSDEDDRRHGIEYSPGGGTIDTRLNKTSNDFVDNLIDPSLREDGPDSSIGGALPQLEAILSGPRPSGTESMDDAYAGYQPAVQPGYIAPSAIMINQNMEEDEPESDSSEPQLDGASRSLKKSGKRKNEASEEIQRLPPKKKKRVDDRNSQADGKPVSGATKQYRRDQEKKALEEARKTGRWIQVQAALKGKQKIVKLRIGPEKLRQWKDGTVTTDYGQESVEKDETNMLLKSDVAPPEPAAEQQLAPSKTTTQPGKQVRVRMEKDDEYYQTARAKRRNAEKSKSSTSNKSNQNFEEVEMDMESDEGGQNTTLTNAIAVSKAGKKERRISSWQARRHDGESDESEITELPPNFKDGRRRTAPESRVDAKSVAQIRPKATPRTSRAAKNATTSKSPDHANEKTNGSPVQVPSRAIRNTERGGRAKKATLSIPNLDGAGDDMDDDDEEEEFIKPVASSSIAATKAAPKPAQESIFTRIGKKIKIVSKAARGAGNTSSTAGPTKSFTAVNSSP